MVTRFLRVLKATGQIGSKFGPLRGHHKNLRLTWLAHLQGSSIILLASKQNIERKKHFPMKIYSNDSDLKINFEIRFKKIERQVWKRPFFRGSKFIRPKLMKIESHVSPRLLQLYSIHDRLVQILDFLVTQFDLRWPRTRLSCPQLNFQNWVNRP